MPQSNLLLKTIFCCLLFFSTKVFSQCPPPVTAAACTGTEPTVTDNETLNAGTTKWYSGPVVTLNSLTMKGGKLIVCGDLTIDKFYMDSGQIIINPGGRFVIGSGIGAGMILRGNSSVYNYGVFETQRNLSLESGWATALQPNIVYNAKGAVFKMPNQYFVINNVNSWFVNNGDSQFWGLITDAQSSAGSVCLGPESTMRMSTLINKVTNTYRVTSGGAACVYVTQLSQFFGALTNSHNLFACLASGHHSDASCVPFGCLPNAWGSAQVFTNCNTCAALGVLPLRFTSLEVTANHSGNIIRWSMDQSGAVYLFYVERSEDGKNFYSIDSLRGAMTVDFNYTDFKATEGINYYRIRCVDVYTRLSLISKVVSSTVPEKTGSRFYPSPFSSYFFISLPPGETVQKIRVHDMNGKMIPAVWKMSGHQWKVTPLIPISKQVLIVQAITDKGIRSGRVVCD